MGTPQISAQDPIPLSEYIRGEFVPLSHLAHQWELHAGVLLTPAEERAIVREPAQAVPAALAGRLGGLRVLVVPYVACLPTGDAVTWSKPKGESHSAVWVETPERIHLVLASKELDSHDTGFEFLASLAELLRAKLTSEELGRYTELLEEELRLGVGGEIDEDALAAKRQLIGRARSWQRSRALFKRYRDVSFSSTLAEYLHGLWHDVQVRIGSDHLPVPQLRRRMSLLAEMFPPNSGYRVFSEELERLDEA